MARPRKVSDEDLFEATLRAMSRLGPGELTLGAIAAEAGVTAAVLVQRFGSRRALLLALAARGAEGTAGFMDALAKQHASPLDALRAWAACMGGLATSPAALARNLAYLQIDLEDPEFREHLARQARETRSGLQRIVESAIAARELRRDTDARRLTGLIEAMVGGAMMTWAHYRKGSAARWIGDHLDALLEPYRARAGTR